MGLRTMALVLVASVLLSDTAVLRGWQLWFLFLWLAVWVYQAARGAHTAVTGAFPHYPLALFPRLRA